jgi:hypothetical protein
LIIIDYYIDYNFSKITNVVEVPHFVVEPVVEVPRANVTT